MWATLNMGASSPGDYGDYYAFGTTTPKSSTVPSSFTINGTMLGSSGGSIAGSSYDAAKANWGGKWLLPTTTEWEELKNNCTYQMATSINSNGIITEGLLLTSNTNGNQLFLNIDDVPAKQIGYTTITYSDFGRYLTSILYSYTSVTYYAYRTYCIAYKTSYDYYKPGMTESYAFSEELESDTPIKYFMVRPVFHP